MLWDSSRGAHLIEGAHGEVEVAVVQGIILGGVIDVGDLADVKLLLLAGVESPQQLGPAVMHQNQALPSARLPRLHVEDYTQGSDLG